MWPRVPFARLTASTSGSFSAARDNPRPVARRGSVARQPARGQLAMHPCHDAGTQISIAALAAAVEQFHRTAAADPRLRRYFPRAGLARRGRQLVAALCREDDLDTGRAPAAFAQAVPVAALDTLRRDLLGHYLISALRDHRLGTDMLIRATVLLTQARSRTPVRIPGRH
jgi:hypothetical protein